MHFDEGLSARHRGGDSTKLVTKGARGKSASEKLTEEGLVKFSARVSIQVMTSIGYGAKFITCKLMAIPEDNVQIFSEDIGG